MEIVNEPLSPPPAFDGYKATSEYWKKRAMGAEIKLVQMLNDAPCPNCETKGSLTFFIECSAFDPMRLIVASCKACGINLADFPTETFASRNRITDGVVKPDGQLYEMPT
jgi:RecJ-like exonuclease